MRQLTALDVQFLNAERLRPPGTSVDCRSSTRPPRPPARFHRRHPGADCRAVTPDETAALTADRHLSTSAGPSCRDGHRTQVGEVRGDPRAGG